MGDLRLNQCPIEYLGSHLAMFGLAAIAEQAFRGATVRLWWSGGMSPRPVVSVDGVDGVRIAAAVRDHAAAASQEGSWVMQRLPDAKGTQRGLMSPRRALPAGADPEEQFTSLIHARRAVVDRIDHSASVLDLRALGGLGEPAFWYRNQKGEPRPDLGASTFDMQPRNQGSELFGNRMQKIGPRVAATNVSAITAELDGTTRLPAPHEFTAPGFTPGGALQPAVAWCALWGLSLLPVAPGPPQKRSTTTGWVARSRDGAATGGGQSQDRFVLPIFGTPVRPSLVRAVLSDARTARLALDGDVAARGVAAGWLRARGAVGVAVFGVSVSGSANAPTRCADLGVILGVGGRVG